MSSNEKRGNFTGKIGFVLAAAGSAVGLGNLWRFPYLAARDGGGLFLVIYIILTLTFGFALLTTQIAVGRKTGHSCIKAYAAIDKRFKFLGYLEFIIPFIIFPYYCVIGGWVSKYGFTYISGQSSQILTGAETQAEASANYFSNFISSPYAPVLWMLFFMGVSCVIVYFGVEKGIEKFSKVLMPALCVIIVGIAVFSLTLRDEASGRTAIDGLKIYIVPNFDGLTVSKFFRILLDACGQLFYSMSIAMGIMVTYGSYAKKETNLVSSVNQIEIFDTGVAILAGLIMIPAVFTFQGAEGLEAAGPGLLFISLPQVFSHMGPVLGQIIGALFFVLVFLAAITSSISLFEAVVSVFMDQFNISRKAACAISATISIVLALVTCFGYTFWYFEFTLPNGATAQILDILDYLTNNLLMPIVALIMSILIGWFAKPKTVIDEVKLNGEKFGREGLYKVIIKYVAPICLMLIFLSSFGLFDKI